MKKFINKHKTKFMIITCILFFGIGVVSADEIVTIFDSEEVSYSNENMDATNVQDAIDELYEKIPTEPTTEDTITKLGTTVVTSGNGLYADSTESGRYIYKGSAPNNYITYNNETWRIYSIEDNGSIKITRSDLLEKRAFDSQTGRKNSSNTYCTSNYGCNAWAPTTYLVETPASFVNGSSSGTVSANSDLNTYLNGTYLTSLTSIAQGQIAVHSWNVGPAGTTIDEYTLSQLVSTDYEGKYKWNGKIALLTKSEYMRASSNTNCVTTKYWYDNKATTTCKGSNYLYNSSTSWWLLSPYSSSNTNVFHAGNDGAIGTAGIVNGGTSDSTRGVRPAVYLKSSIKITGGTGTSTDPYTIE